MDCSTFKVAHEDGVTLVTLNRPEVLNARNTAVMEDLRALSTAVYVEPEQARVVVMTGAGERGFFPGADLTERDANPCSEDVR